MCYSRLALCFPPIYLQDAPEDKRVLASMRWGLIPSWFRGSSPKQMQYSTSNCRSENILEKKSYKVHTNKKNKKLILPVLQPVQSD